ncbi:P26 [Lymantria xylina nucleopolyhedrovirus]|uniref:P26 n=1 Tax=Lymantria xylina multiple nucleopolyhedrovirus TaxID=2847840 RepID=D4N273_9ABAC|nr:P26 [Lymantria xylina nucleopolyhedrovirus]ADD73745.1 P26 [Lymantria xylina nucleopolyhedrovirus]
MSKVSVVLITVAVACAAATETGSGRAHSVDYVVRRLSRTVDVTSVRDRKTVIKIVSPNQWDDEDGDEFAYRYPGAASDAAFETVRVGEKLHVLLDNHTLVEAVATTDEYVFYHTRRRRSVVGRLAAFAVRDFALAARIWPGAPIFRRGRFVSVVTGRYQDYANDRVLFPVTGASAEAAEVAHDRDRLSVNSSPYAPTPPLARAGAFRDWPRVATLFCDAPRRRVVLALTEGEFEIARFTLVGVLADFEHI